MPPFTATLRPATLLPVLLLLACSDPTETPPDKTEIADTDDNTPPTDTDDTERPTEEAAFEAACERYLEVSNACETARAAAAGEEPALNDDSFCDFYRGESTGETVAWLDCLTVAYEGVDCARADAYEYVDITDCSAPG